MPVALRYEVRNSRRSGLLCCGGERHVVVDDDRFHAAIQNHGQDGVFKTAHEHRLVDKLVLRPAQFAKFLPEFSPQRLARGTDKQHFKIGPMCGFLFSAQRQPVSQVGETFLLFFPLPDIVRDTNESQWQC